MSITFKWRGSKLFARKIQFSKAYSVKKESRNRSITIKQIKPKQKKLSFSSYRTVLSNTIEKIIYDNLLLISSMTSKSGNIPN